MDLKDHCTLNMTTIANGAVMITCTITGNALLTQLQGQTVYMTIETKLADPNFTGIINNIGRAFADGDFPAEAIAPTVNVKPTEYIDFTYDGMTAESIVPGKSLNVNARITTSDNRPITMIVAIYKKNGALIKLMDTTGIINNGTIAFNTNLDIPVNTESGAYVKVFFWDSQTFAPVRDAVSFPG